MGKTTVLKPDVYHQLNDRPVEGIKRVAAYCRVSSDKEEQLNSYGNQDSYYKNIFRKIQNGRLLAYTRMKGFLGRVQKREMTFLE